MSSCDVNKCRLTDGGKTLEVDVPNAHGAMAFAFNYIGHYVTPWDWINHPEEVTCHGRRSEKRAPNDITLHASCDSNLNLEIGVYVGHHHIYGVDKACSKCDRLCNASGFLDKSSIQNGLRGARYWVISVR